MTGPLIGITATPDESGNFYQIRKNYMDAVKLAGGCPVLLDQGTADEDVPGLVSRLDGILLSGGGDADPAMYGEEAVPECGKPDHGRDRFEKALFEAAQAQGKPVLGICRGMQMINVFMGGTLWQDIPTCFMPDRHIVHRQTTPGEEYFHNVLVRDGSILATITGLDSFPVNSFHHQGVRQPGKGLKITAFSPNGMPEAIEGTGRNFILGVQWHPEYVASTDRNAYAIFRLFVEACRL